MRRALNKKTDSTDEEDAKKHDRVWVKIADKLIGPVLVSRGSDEMRNREIGNCARSLGLKEHELRELVGCSLSRDDFARLTGCVPGT